MKGSTTTCLVGRSDSMFVLAFVPPGWVCDRGDRYPQGEKRDDVILVKVPEQRVPRTDGLWLPLSLERQMCLSFLFFVQGSV